MSVIFLAVMRFHARAAFNALYVFGDSLSTTTNNVQVFPQSTNYYGRRFCNGRVWVECLAEQQGILYDSNKNWSFFDCGSGDVVTNVAHFNPPTSISNALVVIWVNNADLYDEALNNDTLAAEWANAINVSQTNYFKAVTNLYFAKNVRTLVLPNAADISKVPYFNHYAQTNFIRQQCQNYNAALANTVKRIRTTCPALTVYTPDIFSLVDDLFANPADYGLTNVLKNGISIDALDDPNLKNLTLNGPGGNYIFWDFLDPTARTHAVIGNFVQESIAPAQLTGIAPVDSNYRLDLVNVPVGLNGTVLYATNVTSAAWLTNSTFSSLTLTQGVLVTPTNSQRFYRVKFPYAWTWP
ncbi:MAG: SGNH/GDSL hydrolase family protein [Verrucomicrobiae bacterium]|nr:SGNH/GDSL hydrolase family protein [Verrucomicrobiae bacterium]